MSILWMLIPKSRDQEASLVIECLVLPSPASDCWVPHILENTGSLTLLLMIQCAHLGFVPSWE